MDLMQRRRQMMGSRSLPVEYVTDSLYLWLDGINNTRAGHNQSASYWQDLSGNNFDVRYSSASVKGDYYCIPNAALMLPSTASISKLYTVEFVLDMPNASSDNPFVIVCPAKDASNFVVYAPASDTIRWGTGTSETGFIMPRESAISTYNSQGYLNGEAGAFEKPASTWNYPDTRKLFGYSTTANRVCKQKICALRICTRRLSAREIAQNAAMDRLRFRPFRP